MKNMNAFGGMACENTVGQVVLKKGLDRNYGERNHDLVKANYNVFYEGDAGNDVYYVIDGTCIFYRLLKDGRRLVGGFALPGEFFSVSNGGAYTYTAEAVVDCRYRRFSRTKLLTQIAATPEEGRRIASFLENEPWAMQTEMLKLLHKGADESVAYFLLTIGCRQNPKLGDGSLIALDMSRTDIADYLGLTTETVCRSISRLAKLGIIAASGPHDVVVKDAKALRQRAYGAENDDAPLQRIGSEGGA